MSGKESFDEVALEHIASALYVLKHPRLVEFLFFVCKNEAFTRIWDPVFKLLANVRTQEVEDFFVNFLINDDRYRPTLTKIADDYLA